MQEHMRTAMIFMNLAVSFYSIGVFVEKYQLTLKWWHVIVFWLGFVCDSIGTHAMGQIVGGMFQYNFHSITGVVALILMFFHVVWATWVMIKDNLIMKKQFHKFSIVVWGIWLIPMITGMVFKMIG